MLIGELRSKLTLKTNECEQLLNKTRALESSLREQSKNNQLLTKLEESEKRNSIFERQIDLQKVRGSKARPISNRRLCSSKIANRSCF